MVRTTIAVIGLAATSVNAVSDKEHTNVSFLKKVNQHNKVQQEVEIAQATKTEATKTEATKIQATKAAKETTKKMDTMVNIGNPHDEPEQDHLWHDGNGEMLHPPESGPGSRNLLATPPEQTVTGKVASALKEGAKAVAKACSPNCK